MKLNSLEAYRASKQFFFGYAHLHSQAPCQSYQVHPRDASAGNIPTMSRANWTNEKYHPVNGFSPNDVHEANSELSSLLNAIIKRMRRRLRPRQIFSIVLVLSFFAVASILVLGHSPEPAERLKPASVPPPLPDHEPPAYPAT